MTTVPPTLPPPSIKTQIQDHIFISYSSKDRGFVDSLAQDLRNEGHIVWVDFEDIHGGELWQQSIADAIHASQVMLVALTPDSIQSEWVEAEITRAREEKKIIIPLRVREFNKKEIPKKFASISFVCSLIHWRDFTGGYGDQYAKLLTDLPDPESGIVGHCKKIVAQLAAATWGMDHYIQADARMLPLYASPYEDGVVTHHRENLMKRLWKSDRLIVLGEPGVGKTVALNRLAWELANSDPVVVPIIVRLFNYDGQPLLEWVRLNLVQTEEIPLKTLKETQIFLEDSGVQCYFLLDGLNEVRPQFREKVVGEINRLALEFSEHRLVVTSRIQDDSWKQLRQGHVVHDSMVVQPIRPFQAERYLIAHLGDVDGPLMWEQLDRRMRELASRPLLLWLMKEAWREVRKQQPEGAVDVPKNRGALYRHFVERMLRRDDERRLNEKVPEKQRLAALEDLALLMHQQQSLTISRAEANHAISDDTVDALQVNGLLVGEKELRFAPHQTVQEHFAARAVQDMVLEKVGEKGVGRLLQKMGFGRGILNHANDPWWAETFIQLAGLVNDPNPLALTLADINPWLAWWCVKEGSQVRPQTKHVIEAKSTALITSEWVEDRRRAAETLARLYSIRTIIPLAQLSLDDDHITARIALEALMKFGTAGANALIPKAMALVRSEHTVERQRAAEALSKVQMQRVIEPLAQLSLDIDATTARIALEALVAFGDAGADVLIPKAAALVKSRNSVERQCAATALAKLQTRQAIEPLAVLCIDSDAATASRALAGLLKMGKSGQDAFETAIEQLSPEKRAAWSRNIADMDPRPGVGLDAQGLPDIVWCKVPAGSFLYGDTNQRTPLDHTYSIARYPITNAQFQAFLDADEGYTNRTWWTTPGWSDKGHRTEPDEADAPNFRLPNHPRIYVRWYEAVAFCAWLSEHLGYTVRLPTELEWEKAARSTDGRAYPWGNEFDALKCNNDVGLASIGQTSAVGIFPSGASPCGAMDMSGNVWEWCATEFDSGDIPTAIINNDHRCVLRGGSWDLYYDTDFQTIHRIKDSPNFRLDYIGFRLVRDY